MTDLVMPFVPTPHRLTDADRADRKVTGTELQGMIEEDRRDDRLALAAPAAG